MCISHGDRETSDKIWFSKEILSFTVNTIIGNRNSWNIFFISWSNVTGVDLFTLLFSLNKIYTSSLLALCMLSLWNHNFRKIVWKKNRVIQYLCLCKFLTDYLGLLTAILPLAIYKTLQNLLHKSSGYIWCGHAERNFLERFWNFPQKTFSQIYYLAKAVSSLILSEMAGRKLTASFMLGGYTVEKRNSKRVTKKQHVEDCII